MTDDGGDWCCLPSILPDRPVPYASLLHSIVWRALYSNILYYTISSIGIGMNMYDCV